MMSNFTVTSCFKSCCEFRKNMNFSETIQNFCSRIIKSNQIITSHGPASHANTAVISWFAMYSRIRKIL